MNSLFIAIVGIPAVEIIIMIKIGQNIGALNTVILIFLTAFIGIYYARIEGLNTIKSGLVNMYQNKTPVYEIISGASIAIAAVLLIFPGFITDTIGFILLIPFTRKIIINKILKNKKNLGQNKDVLDGEIIEEKKDDEL